jgi:hypothetical protein
MVGGSSGLNGRFPAFLVRSERFSSKDDVGVRRDKRIFWGLSSSSPPPPGGGADDRLVSPLPPERRKTEDGFEPPRLLAEVEEGASTGFGTWIGVVPPRTKLVPPPLPRDDEGWLLGFPDSSRDDEG